MRLHKGSKKIFADTNINYHILDLCSYINTSTGFIPACQTAYHHSSPIRIIVLVKIRLGGLGEVGPEVFEVSTALVQLSDAF